MNEVSPWGERRSEESVSRARTDPGRLADLRSRGWLDRPTDAALDGLTRVAATALRAPIALLTLVDSDRDFYASAFGSWPPDGAREFAGTTFCQLTLTMSEPLAVVDALTSPVLRDLDVVRDGHIESFLGVPLISTAGHHVGCLCVANRAPHTWSPHESAVLVALGAAALLALQRKTELEAAQAAVEEERRRRSHRESRLAAVEGDVRSSLSALHTICESLERSDDPQRERLAIGCRAAVDSLEAWALAPADPRPTEPGQGLPS